MVLIPAGEFRMGSDHGRADEKPVHRVHVDAFYIDRHEVTNRRYRAFVNVRGHPTPRYWDDARFNAAEQPVVGVSWDDAAAFARWAGKALPTEAQWEKAARAGLDGKRYPWGDQDPGGRASYGQNTMTGKMTGKPAVVGHFAPNRYGLFDMAGNVWEWCADRYGEGYYAKGPAGNPRGPSSGSGRVVRGGSWGNGDFNLRCAFRFGDVPSYTGSLVGFRCARSL
jgi:formylglycine-generating enzyme required for sulfatase activity